MKAPPTPSNRVGTPSIANSGRRHSPPRAVEREVAGRVAVGGGVLVLPTVAYFGVPVVLDVPDLGYVQLSEERYAELYDKLFSVDAGQVQEAIAALKEVKAAEDAELEALQHGPINVLPPDADAPADLPADVERDLSEPISFERLPFKIQLHRPPNRSQRLY
jgi:hypothetical protein